MPLSCRQVDATGPQLRFDTLLVTGGDVFPAHPVDPELREAVTSVAARSGRVCSICTGAFILAAAGLLDGRRATTHWRHTGVLRRGYPDIIVEPDAIFVRDGTTFTSAGVTAGIDLALALLEDDHGEQMARQVAQSLVVFLQRPGRQSQFSPTLSGPRPRTSALRSVFDAVAADPAADHSTPKLAALAAMSPRHLTRLFHEELSTTPAKVRRGRALRRRQGSAGFGLYDHRGRRASRLRQLRNVTPRVRGPTRGVTERLPAAVPVRPAAGRRGRGRSVTAPVNHAATPGRRRTRRAPRPTATCR